MRLLKNSAGIAVFTIPEYSKINMVKAGMQFERFWLTLAKYHGYLQPFAPMSFFTRRIKYLDGKGFSAEEIKSLKNLEGKLRKILKIDGEVAFLCRYGIANEPKMRTGRKFNVIS